MAAGGIFVLSSAGGWSKNNLSTCLRIERKNRFKKVVLHSLCIEEETTQQRYKQATERIFASKQINQQCALAIYAMGPEAVVFALLTLHSQKQSDASSIESSPAEELSRPSATIPPYQKPNQGSSRKKKPGRKSGFIG